VKLAQAEPLSHTLTLTGEWWAQRRCQLETHVTTVTHNNVYTTRHDEPMKKTTGHEEGDDDKGLK
jgi:hypothetical protein